MRNRKDRIPIGCMDVLEVCLELQGNNQRLNHTCAIADGGNAEFGLTDKPVHW